MRPLALLLWLAAALAGVSGSTVFAVAIVAVIVLNAGLAFVQEQQAERAVEVDISTLTWESMPADRSADLRDVTGPLLDARDLVFNGTNCTAGEARAMPPTACASSGVALQTGGRWMGAACRSARVARARPFRVGARTLAGRAERSTRRRGQRREWPGHTARGPAERGGHEVQRWRRRRGLAESCLDALDLGAALDAVGSLRGVDGPDRPAVRVDVDHVPVSPKAHVAQREREEARRQRRVAGQAVACRLQA